MQHLIAWVCLLLLSSCGENTKSPASPVQPEGPAAADSTRIAVFADTSLEAAVRQALGNPAGPLTQEALLSLTQLVARGRGIRDLQGIEQLDSLTTLDLADNQIQDISPSAALTQLAFLDLTSNAILDISVLAELPRLESVVLDNNRVRDLAPLLGLRNLRHLEVSGNPLDPNTSVTQLAALQAAGVKVVFRAYQELPPPPAPPKEYNLLFVGESSGIHQDIFIVRTDGSDPVNITNKPAKYTSVHMSRDGARVAFMSDRDNIPSPNYYLFVMDADGGAVVNLTQGQLAIGLGTAWSPDGTRIAFLAQGPTRADLYVIDADGSNLTNLTNQAPAVAELWVGWIPE